MEQTSVVSIAVIVPVFNGLKFTKDCLQTLSKQSKTIVDKASIKVVLFDDGSSDGTSEWVSCNYPEVIILSGDGSNWWSCSVNKCTEYILKNDLADFIVWWNNDVEPSDNYFAQVLSILPIIKDHTVAGSKIYVKGSNKIWGMGGFFNPKNGVKYQYAFFVDDEDKYKEAVEVDWLPGMGTIAHKSIHQSVGLIDDDKFPQYHGDLDFTYRAKLAGYSVKVYPQIKIYNNIVNTGIKEKNTWKEMRQTMKSIKSLYNWKIDILLYKKFTKVPFSYVSLLSKYGKFVGGFFKKKVSAFLGISVKE